MKERIGVGMACVPVGSSVVMAGHCMQFITSPQVTFVGPYLLTFAFAGGSGCVHVKQIMMGADSLIYGAFNGNDAVDARSFMRSVLLPNGDTDWAPIPLDGPMWTQGKRLLVELRNQTPRDLHITTTLFGYSSAGVEHALERARPMVDVRAIMLRSKLLRGGAPFVGGDCESIRDFMGGTDSRERTMLEALSEQLIVEREGHRQWRAAAEAATFELRVLRERQAAELAVVTDPSFLARARDAVQTLEALEHREPFEPGDVWETSSDES